MAACWEPSSSSPSIAGQGVPQCCSPLPYPPGCPSPSLLSCIPSGAFSCWNPWKYLYPPQESRAGCVEPPKPQGLWKREKPAAGGRPKSTFLLSSGPASLHSSAWDGDEPQRATSTAVTCPGWDVLFSSEVGPYFFPPPSL